jgi:hypothetical protein
MPYRAGLSKTSLMLIRLTPNDLISGLGGTVRMGASMIRRVNRQYFALVFLITLCQVIATVCTLHDLSAAAGAALLVEERMACPMGGTTMCPSSLTSSPERQIKHSMVSDVDSARGLLSVSTALRSPSIPGPWSESSALSIVPISRGSSSVLRI